LVIVLSFSDDNCIDRKVEEDVGGPGDEDDGSDIIGVDDENEDEDESDEEGEEEEDVDEKKICNDDDNGVGGLLLSLFCCSFPGSGSVHSFPSNKQS
jgi:hypothetical protein